MNSERKNIITLLGTLTLLTLILFHSQVVKASIISGTEVWLTKVFPSLFPMFILSDILITYHFPEYLANSIGQAFQKIFHTTPYGVFAFFMSLIAGTPSSAYILKNLTEENKISETEASFLLSFTFFSNPLFLITMLSLLFPTSPTYIWLIILIHYGSNIIIGILFRPKNVQIPKKLTPNIQPIDFGSVLSNAIKNSINTLFVILGTICFYFMIASIITMPKESYQIIWKGFLELTQGLNALIPSNFSLTIKSFLAISFISFGGLSIHTQIKSIISDTNISYMSFLKGRVFHTILSNLLLLLTTTAITIIS